MVREARRALEEGTPRLLFLGPPEELAGHERDGVVTVPIACQSEGAMEVHVEPVLPQPQFIAIGRSPAAIALDRDGGRAGMAERRRRRRRRSRAIIPERAACSRRSTSPRRTWTSARSSSSRRRATTTRQRSSTRSRRRPPTSASSRPARAPKRCSGTSGIAESSEEALARVHAPAGLDLGRIDSEEIAAAILAEIVQLKAGGGLHGVRRRGGSPRATRRSTPSAG